MLTSLAVYLLSNQEIATVQPYQNDVPSFDTISISTEPSFLNDNPTVNLTDIGGFDFLDMRTGSDTSERDSTRRVSEEREESGCWWHHLRVLDVKGLSLEEPSREEREICAKLAREDISTPIDAIRLILG